MMKELLRSKSMIGFILFVVGVVSINSVNIKSEVKMSNEVNNSNQIVYNK